MTDTKILTDFVRGGTTVEFTVTADTSSLDIESMVLDAQREQATLVHERLAEHSHNETLRVASIVERSSGCAVVA